MHTTYSTSCVFPDKIEVLSEGSNFGKFSILPFQKGFGITIGNSLRRILLSSIRGVVFSEFKISGADFDLSAIKSVKEDVSQIAFNLRKTILASDLESGSATISVKGPKVVYASDINFQSSSTFVINQNHYLFEITADISVNLELKFIAGIGDVFVDYESSGKRKKLGDVELDMHFSPVENVSFSVQKTRVGDRMDYDELIIGIRTNGSITPIDALQTSVTIMVDTFSQISKIKTLIFENLRSDKNDSKNNESNESEYNYNLLRKVSDFEISVRSANCLAAEGIIYVGQLVQYNAERLMKTPNFGRKSLDEITELLERLDLSLGMDIVFPPENFQELLQEADAFLKAE